MSDSDSSNGSSLPIAFSQDHDATFMLQYVNSQLVAHGFAQSPGLSLNGLANEDSKSLIKCLFGMLSQRMDDLGRTEELNSRLRRISYEHERLESIHRTTLDDFANAEREMNFCKSRLAASQRSLACETSAHKQTSTELQRTRTSLQYLRSTTQNELRRKDKEADRVLERWNKVVDGQIKLLNAQCGLRCANSAIETGEQVRCKGLMETALEQAEEARVELVKENDGFKAVLLDTANALQAITYEIKSTDAYQQLDKPSRLSHLVLFAPPTSSLSQPDNAHTKLRELFVVLRETVLNISSIASSTPSPSAAAASEKEILELKEMVTTLRTEIDKSRQPSTSHAQALLDRLIADVSERNISEQNPTSEEVAEISLELIGTPERDEIRERLEKRTNELEQERKMFTEAALKLDREKAALEMEQAKLLEEKRRWTVEQMLAELPSTPDPNPDLVSPSFRIKSKTRHVSPTRVRPCKASGYRVPLGSPSKQVVIKRVAATGTQDTWTENEMSGMKTHASSCRGMLKISQDLGGNPGDTNNDMDAKLQNSTTPDDTPPATTVTGVMKKSLPLILPTTFTLPPPSPASSVTALDLKPMSAHSPARHQTITCFDAISLASTPSISPLLCPRVFVPPSTPCSIPNPHLRHAYSPARPSPLSRMLALANSPPSPIPIPPIQEINEDEDDYIERSLPEMLCQRPTNERSSLRESSSRRLNENTRADTMLAKELNREKRFTAKEKGKGRAVLSTHGSTATAEKENVLSNGKAKAITLVATETPRSKVKSHKPETGKASRPKSFASSKDTTKVRKLGLGVTSRFGNGNNTATIKPGGARRVLVGSAGTHKLKI